MEGRNQADETAYAERIQMARDVAKVIRSNIVQGIKEKEDDTYSALLHTESL